MTNTAASDSDTEDVSDQFDNSNEEDESNSDQTSDGGKGQFWMPVQNASLEETQKVRLIVHYVGDWNTKI